MDSTVQWQCACKIVDTILMVECPPTLIMDIQFGSVGVKGWSLIFSGHT